MTDSAHSTDDTYRCLRVECQSKDVDIVGPKWGKVHISCNRCGWLHRDVPADSE